MIKSYLPLNLDLSHTACKARRAMALMLTLDEDKGQLAKILNRPYPEHKPHLDAYVCKRYIAKFQMQ